MALELLKVQLQCAQVGSDHTFDVASENREFTQAFNKEMAMLQRSVVIASDLARRSLLCVLTRVPLSREQQRRQKGETDGAAQSSERIDDATLEAQATSCENSGPASVEVNPRLTTSRLLF